ncbi:hypothetical protein LTR78_001366 [Recurvomyces mirabilis]|uniref:Uncharacterized protein n=1 Tax=Recurvomyces mirabilis TaxID=574656 RepID=A0AAE1C5K2_9PEZI|nr:hypothetical protein LTR78_001366 [Recurvomyces mirabilis]KAK5161343.1 hypothetical protein LTS14_001139 [Recurvomyces mirabilis]
MNVDLEMVDEELWATLSGSATRQWSDGVNAIDGFFADAPIPDYIDQGSKCAVRTQATHHKGDRDYGTTDDQPHLGMPNNTQLPNRAREERAAAPAINSSATTTTDEFATLLDDLNHVGGLLETEDADMPDTDSTSKFDSQPATSAVHDTNRSPIASPTDSAWAKHLTSPKPGPKNHDGKSPTHTAAKNIPSASVLPLRTSPRCTAMMVGYGRGSKAPAKEEALTMASVAQVRSDKHARLRGEADDAAAKPQDVTSDGEMKRTAKATEADIDTRREAPLAAEVDSSLAPNELPSASATPRKGRPKAKTNEHAKSTVLTVHEDVQTTPKTRSAMKSQEPEVTLQHQSDEASSPAPNSGTSASVEQSVASRTPRTTTTGQDDTIADRSAEVAEIRAAKPPKKKMKRNSTKSRGDISKLMDDPTTTTIDTKTPGRTTRKQVKEAYAAQPNGAATAKKRHQEK